MEIERESEWVRVSGEMRIPPADSFLRRHLGPDEEETREMLEFLGLSSLDELSDLAVPTSIRLTEALELGDGMTEYGLLQQLREVAAANSEVRSYIGMGYSDCITPPVIQRNILENPAWYTQYTPYQSEIAQGRLEALLNFQTMVMDLTGMELANASLLDEATAAAEAMAMLFILQGKKGNRRSFFVSSACHPQTIEVVNTRAWSKGWEIVVGDHRDFDFDGKPVFGALLQFPTTDGAVWSDCDDFCGRAHEAGALVAVAADILSLAILKPPGELGADVVVGSTQRLGMPMGYGGPHAAYFATRERFKRHVPGRIVGVTEDILGTRALRMALQTREQHIRRERATSNICTSQVLPAVVASMYAVHHGPDGLRRIATSIHSMAQLLAAGGRSLGFELVHERFFDTVSFRCEPERVKAVRSRAAEAGVNLRWPRERTDSFCISVDETTSKESIAVLLTVLSPSASSTIDLRDLQRESEEEGQGGKSGVGEEMTRTSDFLSHEVFNSYRSETEMLRYMRRLDSRDLSLTTSMIPLGSCTMKLNATVEMMPITWPEFARPHPFAPTDQNAGYMRIFDELSAMLVEITGLAAVSLQPNAGSQGEYAGLLAIRRFCDHRGCPQRRICLIPASAHGTNPASAVMAGFEVVVVNCDAEGNIDVDDLRSKAAAHPDDLAALMVTYPSTHGVFEEGIRTICDIVHQHGGQVYMDGANMNALVGMCRPGEIGVDVCHLNLHKTFCIPHGGGGPGMGPIAVADHLAPFLPGHPLTAISDIGGIGEPGRTGAVAAAPWSSALVLLISWAYLKLMGGAGLLRATQLAILNANYIAARLDPHYPVLYKGDRGLVAHEAILDLRSFKALGIEVDDVAKRLMDYGFHAPTVHFPVPGTVMVEPTESESKRELDRFCEAMMLTGEADAEDNPIRNAPHCISMVIAADWSHPYSRAEAVTPADWLHEHKFWPYVARVNNTLGDRNLICSCPPTGAYGNN